jgi:hypothetical protein
MNYADFMCQQNLDRVITLSLGFLFLFTAGNTAQDLISEVLEDNDFGRLGFFSLGIMYCIFGICSFLSAPLITRWGEKMCFVIGSACFVI